MRVVCFPVYLPKYTQISSDVSLNMRTSTFIRKVNQSKSLCLYRHRLFLDFDFLWNDDKVNWQLVLNGESQILGKFHCLTLVSYWQKFDPFFFNSIIHKSWSDINRSINRCGNKFIQDLSNLIFFARIYDRKFNECQKYAN